MTNVRVFQLARDLNLSSQEVVDRLRKLGVEVKTASSSIDEDTADKLKRALKIDQLTSRKRRIYGSEEDEAERELQEQAAAARIAAEKEERERAAAEAAAAAEARKHKKPRVAVPPPPPGAEAKGADAKAPAPTKAPPAEEPPPALIHPPGAPRLAPKVIAPIAPVVEEEPIEDEPEAEEPVDETPEPVEVEEVAAVEAVAPDEAPAVEASAPAAPEPVKPTVPIRPTAPIAPTAPVAAPAPTATPIAPPAPPAPTAPVAVAPPAAVAPQAPAVVRPVPRVSGPVRPIAPPPPPPPRIVQPRPVSTTAPGAPMAARPNLPPPTGLARPVRPIAPPRSIAPRPAGPHPTSAHPSGGALPRSPHPTAPGRPGMGAPPGSRPMSPFPGAGMRPVGRPSPKRNDRTTRGVPPPAAPERPTYSGPPRKITLTEGVTVKELGEKMADVKGRDIMKALIQRGIMATVNQTLDQQVAVDLSKEFGYEASFQSFEEEVVQEQAPASNPEDLVQRAPVVTVMGHVDHGKTSLLDAIRTTTVAAKEAGGITQHIGAYHVDVGARKVVFLDTPGHEAFTLMRARGAKVTDIVILVVAADDGVMPQTVEAMDHARAAGVPIIVAVNKIDKPDAQPDRVKQQLSDRGLMPEEWGGTTVFVNVSAKKKQNLEQLLEMILLVADLGELKANPKRPAVGTVLEARLDKGRGPVATILVQDGVLAVGDTVVAGAVSGRVRAITDDQGARLTKAGPSTPVELQGLSGVPEPGDQFLVVTDLMKAQSIVAYRQLRLREKAMAASSKIKLEDLSRAIADGQLQELPLVIKADVQGSVEAVSDQLMKIPQQKIKLRIIRSGAGAISEGDVLLAAASDAVVIGFNVRPERKAQEAADRDKVELRLYTVIYDAVEDIKKALEGLLAPTIKEVRLGAAEVREAFKISKVGTIAGSFVTDGRVNRNAQVRLLRDNVVIHTGKVASLKRFKEDATEVKSGSECGIGIAGYNDIKPGDVIEFFTTEKVKETLA
jgi:translation initiation factor IF-2